MLNTRDPVAAKMRGGRVAPARRPPEPEFRTDATRTIVGPDDWPGTSRDFSPRLLPDLPGGGGRLPRSRTAPGAARVARPARHVRRKARHEPRTMDRPASAGAEGLVPALHVRPDAPGA